MPSNYPTFLSDTSSSIDSAQNHKINPKECHQKITNFPLTAEEKNLTPLTIQSSYLMILKSGFFFPKIQWIAFLGCTYCQSMILDANTFLSNIYVTLLQKPDSEDDFCLTTCIANWQAQNRSTTIVTRLSKKSTIYLINWHPYLIWRAQQQQKYKKRQTMTSGLIWTANV